MRRRPAQHGPAPLDLGIDGEDLALCVQCGLCLPHCPTYRVTGEESASPRGRIAAMRLVAAGAPAGADFTRFMDLCVQCRGCEAACPSSVPFGRMMEASRSALATQTRYQPAWRRLAYRALAHPRLLGAAARLTAVGQRLGLVPGRLGLPRLSWRRPPLADQGRDAWLLTGCVMDAFMRPVHAAAQRVLAAAGTDARPSPPGCCGALAAHAGLTDIAHHQAAQTMASMPGDAPVIVDSAGCGAYMKEYGRVLGPDGEAFAARVRDISEWLAEHPLAEVGALPIRVAIQDPCHLRHVQKTHGTVRTVLASAVSELVELADDGLCCGAGGSYSVWHPEMAARIRARKLSAISASGASVVVSANPGCAMHLAAAGIDVRHPVEVLDEAISSSAGKHRDHG
jgi:glycolate oxidase iron-sulfur subunit